MKVQFKIDIEYPEPYNKDMVDIWEIEDVLRKCTNCISAKVKSWEELK